MKKALLFLILATTLNVFGQSNNDLLNFQDGNRHIHILNSKTNFGQDIAKQATTLNSVVGSIDSSLTWDYDTLNIGWNITGLSIYTYDENTYQGCSLFQNWNDSTWVNNGKNIFNYNANNNMTSQLAQSWNDSIWINTGGLATYMYDSNNNQTSNVYQNWNGSTWVNGYQVIYTYDSNNNQTSQLSQVWNSNTWVNAELNTYTYDSNNNCISNSSQTWISSTSGLTH